MANYPFSFGRINRDGVVVEVKYYLCDTYAGRPVTGLNVGDFGWMVDIEELYIANSETTWVKVALYSGTGDITFIDGTVKVEDGILLVLAGSALEVGGDTYLNLVSLAGPVLGPYVGVSGTVPLVGTDADPPVEYTIGKVARLDQNAGIAPVNLTNNTPAGLYRVSYFLRCTTADVTAGTITFTISFTDGTSTTFASAAVPLTSITQKDSGTFIANLASGNITWATALTGIAGSSKYRIRVRCEYLG